MTHSFFGVNRGHSETTTTIRFEGRTAYASTSFHTVSFLTNARDDQLLDTRSNLQSSDLPKSFFTSSVRSDDACNSSTIGIESQVDQHGSYEMKHRFNFCRKITVVQVIYTSDSTYMLHSNRISQPMERARRNTSPKLMLALATHPVQDASTNDVPPELVQTAFPWLHERGLLGVR